MSEPNDEELARLLSGRNEPSVLEREAVFRKVMADVSETSASAPASARRTTSKKGSIPLWYGSAGVLAVAAALVFWFRSESPNDAEPLPSSAGGEVARPRPDRGASPAVPDHDLRARGRATQPNFRMVCHATETLDADEPVCVEGGRLALEVFPSQAGQHFAAFAQRVDGRILWYRPAEGEASKALSHGSEGAWLEQATALTGDHGAGCYYVFGVFSDRPMTRGDLRSALSGLLAEMPKVDSACDAQALEPEFRRDLSDADGHVEVVRRTLRVAARPIPSPSGEAL